MIGCTVKRHQDNFKLSPRSCHDAYNVNRSRLFGLYATIRRLQVKRPALGRIVWNVSMILCSACQQKFSKHIQHHTSAIAGLRMHVNAYAHIPVSPILPLPASFLVLYVGKKLHILGYGNAHILAHIPGCGAHITGYGEDMGGIWARIWTYPG